MPEPRSGRLSATLQGGPRPGEEAQRRRIAQLPPWACGLALALPLALVYLVVHPPSADLAAATYRSDLFARYGFTIWDTGWYDGHALPSYSLLSPALGAWIGLRELLALSAAFGATMFGLIAGRAFAPGAARAATLALAFGFCCELPSGRVPYDLGAAIAFACVAALSSQALRRARAPLGYLLAVIAAVASPVAGAFLGLAGLAWAGAGVRERRRARATEGLGLCLASLAPVLLLAVMFPEGGYEPFAGGALWPQLAAALAVAAFLPRGSLSARGQLAIRAGAAIYAVALLAAWALRTPVGSNAERLGELVGPPLVVGVLWSTPRLRALGGLPDRLRARLGAERRPMTRGRRVLLLLAPLLLYWQLSTSIDDQVALAGDPTVNASFYAPLRSELRQIARNGPIRVEVPLTGAHWESAYLPGDGVSIARGWDRQLDTRYAAIFYRPTLSASVYERWLHTNAISYVALPQARFDSAGQAEAQLVANGLPYLHEIWHGRRWRLFAVTGATPLAQRPSRLLALNSDSFALTVPHPGSYEVRLRFTPYWEPSTAGACIMRARDGYTEIDAQFAGTVHVGISFALSRIFSHGRRC